MACSHFINLPMKHTVWEKETACYIHKHSINSFCYNIPLLSFFSDTTVFTPSFKTLDEENQYKTHYHKLLSCTVTCIRASESKALLDRELQFSALGEPLCGTRLLVPPRRVSDPWEIPVMVLWPWSGSLKITCTDVHVALLQETNIIGSHQWTCRTTHSSPISPNQMMPDCVPRVNREGSQKHYYS